MTNDYWRIGLIVALVSVTAGVFVVDLLTPLGIEVWVLYLPVILSITFFKKNTYLITIFVATTCSVLIIIGYFVSPPSPISIPEWWDQLNRAMGVLAIWLLAAAGVSIAVRSEQLRTTLAELRLEVESRKHAEILLRESEERMRLAMESGGLGTRDVDLQNNHENWSETHFRICGYQPVFGGAALSDMLDRLIHHDDSKRILEARQQACEERTLYHVEYRLHRADTLKIVWVEVWGRYYYNQKGEPVRFIGICFDITRRKELERKELEREVLEITTRQQKLTGQDLHDGLGQELTGLGLMAQTLAQQLPDDSLANRIATRLIAGLDHAHRIVRELSRGLLVVEVDAKGLASALKELAKWTTEHTGIPVVVDCPSLVEMPDQMIATHVFRIAQEAVSNALRHAQPRRIRLSLSFEAQILQLDIKDDGIGIHRQTELCEGLGLRIMNYRTGLIGGVLKIDSLEEGGTVVSLTLPLEGQ